MPVAGQFLVPFTLVLGLSLESGGYDIVSRSQIAIVVWWLVLFAVAFGLVPLIRFTAAGWALLAVLAGLTVWTAIATLTWTESTERSVIEVSRTFAMLGFLLALLLFQGRNGMKVSVGALGAAVGMVAAVAVASRYHPGWFDTGELPLGYPVSRLSYPLGYWNGLAALMAIGLPALAWITTEARNLYFRALAAGAIPLLILATFMTASRGGIGAMALSILLLIVVYPRRLVLLASMTVPAIGSVVLLRLLNGYPELRDNLGGVAGQQGNEMTWLTIVVVLLVAAASWQVHSKLLGSRIRIPEVSRSITTRVGIVFAGLAIVVCAVFVGSGGLADQWNEFKKPVTTDPTVDRLTTLSSGERYENWATAIDAGRAEPLTGTGPGTFEYLWSRNGDGSIFVRDAHSFYFEMFGELGVLGLLAGLALVFLPIGLALFGSVRVRVGDRRSLFAAAAAGMTAFAIGAAVDWSWEMAALSAAFLVYAAAVCGPDAELRSGRMHAPDFRLPLLEWSRIWIVLVSVIAIVILYVPMKGTTMLRDSQALYRAGDPEGSLAKAQDLRNFNPWSSSAAIQVALLEYDAGNFPAAFDAADDAADLDPYSWKAWQVLARMAEADGQSTVEEEALNQVSELNYERRSVRDG